jgi:putative transposase
MAFLQAVLGLFGTLLSGRSLVLENLALRQQLAVLRRQAPRPRLRVADRLFWVALARLWPRWREALHLVKPETVIAWHRAGFRLFWRWRSSRGGRPRVDAEVQALVRQMASDNPSWGAPRIHGELLKLGYRVAQSTVAKYMPPQPKTRKPPSQAWRTFLRNHMSQAAAMDFFVIPTATFQLLYGFVILEHGRRRIRHVAVTAHPTAEWTSQQLREAFPFDSAPRFLHRDRDGIYGKDVTDTIRAMGIRDVPSAPASPWQNPYCERVIGTLRRELLDHVIVLDEAHARRLLREYVDYYNGSRTHLALVKDSPEERAVEPPSAGPVDVRDMLGGLHHRYFRRAA